MSGFFEQAKSKVCLSEGTHAIMRPLVSTWEQRKFSELYVINNERNESCEFGYDKTLSVATMTYNGGNGAADNSLSTYKVVRVGDIAFEGHTNKEHAYGRFVLNDAGDGLMSPRFSCLRPIVEQRYSFWKHYIPRESMMRSVLVNATKSGTMMNELVPADLMRESILVPVLYEQETIGRFFKQLDDLITLHQREPTHMMKEGKMPIGINEESLFCDYYSQWISVYKEGAIREVTMGKYRLTQSWLAKLIPDLKIKDLDRTSYQQLINGYAEHHERQTTMDFHHQLKGAILDAVDEGLISRDPTRKAIIKGKQPRAKKIKYLNQFELHAMLGDLDLSGGPSWDWLILIVAKTGLRFSEALGLTPEDFDFAHQTLSVNKTWDYKNGGGFVPTKNASSMRKVQLDWQLIMQLSGLLKDLPPTEPIFVKGKVYNSTANSVLARHCKNVSVPTISVHGLRHTHASLLLFAGVSIASVSRRLGHASMTTTQETYLHVIQELENKDIDIVMRALSTLI